MVVAVLVRIVPMMMVPMTTVLMTTVPMTTVPMMMVPMMIANDDGVITTDDSAVAGNIALQNNFR
jgi:hypothetical protein